MLIDDATRYVWVHVAATRVAAVACVVPTLKSGHYFVMSNDSQGGLGGGGGCGRSGTVGALAE